jgi:hypothetical protein
MIDIAREMIGDQRARDHGADDAAKTARWLPEGNG